MADTTPDPSVPPDPLARQMKLDSLKERIARADYAVDPDAVAEAVNIVNAHVSAHPELMNIPGTERAAAHQG